MSEPSALDTLASLALGPADPSTASTPQSTQQTTSAVQGSASAHGGAAVSEDAEQVDSPPPQNRGFLQYKRASKKLTKGVKGSKGTVRRLSASKYYKEHSGSRLGDRRLITQPNGSKVYKYLAKRSNGSVFWSPVSPKRTVSPKRKSVKKTSAKRKSVKRTSAKRKTPVGKTCKQYLSDKIRTNIKEGVYNSRSQAIAVAYSQVGKARPGCKGVFTKSRKR